MIRARTRAVLTLASFLLASVANAAYILEIDTDGLDDGALTFNSRFTFGGDTTIASQSAASTAFGSSGADSIFGGDGINEVDTYIYTYNPSIDGDNLAITAGQDLGNGNFASGATAGGTGLYNVFATWPFTSNVSGGDTLYEIVTTGSSDSNSINQNGPGNAGLGNVWVLVGQVTYTSGNIVVTQSAGSNTFVSMRAAALLFEPASGRSTVPEPSSLLLMGVGLAGILLKRRSVSN
ncbi:MAG: PEP-CTERM sorting domain-containing protein [Bryobacterales bacterium]